MEKDVCQCQCTRIYILSSSQRSFTRSKISHTSLSGVYQCDNCIMRLFSARVISPTDPRAAPESWLEMMSWSRAWAAQAADTRITVTLGHWGWRRDASWWGYGHSFHLLLHQYHLHVDNQTGIEAWWQHWSRGGSDMRGPDTRNCKARRLWDPDTQIVTHGNQEGDDLSSHHRGWSRVCHARKQILELRNSEIQTRKNVSKNRARAPSDRIIINSTLGICYTYTAFKSIVCVAFHTAL